MVSINEYLIMAAPFLNLKIIWHAVKNNVNITGSKAGYNSKLPIKSPFNKAMKERCIPQPGQSIPEYFL